MLETDLRSIEKIENLCTILDAESERLALINQEEWYKLTSAKPQNRTKDKSRFKEANKSTAETTTFDLNCPDSSRTG